MRAIANKILKQGRVDVNSNMPVVDSNVWEAQVVKQLEIPKGHFIPPVITVAQ